MCHKFLAFIETVQSDPGSGIQQGCCITHGTNGIFKHVLILSLGCSCVSPFAFHEYLFTAASLCADVLKGEIHFSRSPCLDYTEVLTLGSAAFVLR